MAPKSHFVAVIPQLSGADLERNMTSLGLGVLTPLCDPQKANVDIVFVHGLNGDPIKTWTAGETCWPRDLLKDDIDNARVLTFGYDAKVIHFWSQPSQNRIDNHADALLADLVSLRDRTQTNERPLIFVAHSLGGLVCAKALLLAQIGPPRIKQISTCTRNLAFLGTPHAGSSLAGWAEAGRKFLRYITLDSNKELLKNLDRNSEVLCSLGRDFPMFLESRLRDGEEIMIMCFFEGKKFKGLEKIVTEESACLSGKPRLSLYADHVEMCKYEDKDDENYKKVAGILEIWARECVSRKDKNEKAATTINNISADFSKSTVYGLAVAQVVGPLNMSGWTQNYDSKRID